MKFTTRSRYGTRLLMDIALSEKDGPVSLRDVSLRQDISMKYLEKLCRILRGAGYLESVAGAKGGYRLHVHPAAIRMGDVVFLLENGQTEEDCGDELKPCCDRLDACLTRSIWTRAVNAMRLTLNGVSLEDMLRDACFCPKNNCSVSVMETS
jgi:Rrf2 family protein